jgi:redox-sensitive bicupin YhaK (pirin superfamily)
MYVVNKWADELQPGAEASPTIPAQHSMIYVARGSASVNGQGIDADSAIYVEDFAHIKAGKDGGNALAMGNRA